MAQPEVIPTLEEIQKKLQLSVMEKIFLERYLKFLQQNHLIRPITVAMSLSTYKLYAKDQRETYPAYYTPRGLRDPVVPIIITPFVNEGMVIFSSERL